ncbi:MAG: hypothetical protein QOE07_774 [Acidimicrobiaceae bacterium]|nr:hypothetical protein [Acidimicrobiaceae bacterium]
MGHRRLGFSRAARVRPGLCLLSVPLLLLALAVPVPAAVASPVRVTPSVAVGSSRASAYAAYQNVLKPALAVPIGWTGSTSDCVAGAPSAPAQDATLTAVNFFRDMAGLPAVTFDASLSAKAQQAALMMYAQGQLSHNPVQPWACYSEAGRQAAGSSNLYLGVAGAAAIAGYMVDPGSGNTFAGHRRWILYPPQSVMGSGSTCCSNALYVFGPQTAPASPPAWVPWPSAGYVPVQLEPGGRWSLSSTDPTTDFSAAQVSVTSAGVPVPVTVETVVDGYGNNTLVWELDPGYGTGRADRSYDVSVTNIHQGADTVAHQYTVTLFDGEIDADQTIAFSPLPARVYGDAVTVTASASSGLTVTFTSATPSVCTTGGANGATISLVGAGTCTIQADQGGDAIRNPAPRVSRSFSVAKKPLTVQAIDIARPIGAANPAFNVTYSGFVYGQTLATSGTAGAPSCTTTATVQSPAGAYPISCTAGTLASTNYTFSMVGGTLTVAHTYVAVSPARLVDTRPSGSTVDGVFRGGGPLPGGTSVNVTVTGRGGVPAGGVGAVVLNVTAVDPTAASFLTVWPTGEARPNASNLNFPAGQTIPNLVIAKVGSNGQVSVFNQAGSAQLVIDVAGWFPAG